MESTILSLNRMAEQVRKISNYSPSIGLVLGTGFSNFVSRLENPKFISFKNIPGMPVTTNPAHKGEFVIGRYAGITFIVSNGRVHNYEGYTSSEVVTPIRVMGLLGIRGLILTNAAGALNPKYRAGDLMIIEDYISSFVPSPLIGENIDELGTRFPDMSNVFDKEVTNSVYQKAIEKGIAVKKVSIFSLEDLSMRAELNPDLQECSVLIQSACRQQPKRLRLLTWDLKSAVSHLFQIQQPV